MAEYSRRAQGVLKVGSNNKLFVSLPFIPDFIQVYDISRWANPVNSNNPYLMWNRFMQPGDGLALIYNQSAVPNVSMNYMSAYPDGITPVINGEPLTYGPPLQIQAISEANPAQVTCAAPHNLNTGDVVILEGLYQSATTGMQQIAGIPFAITRVGSSIFSINWNTNQSNYTAISGSPSGCVYRVVKNPYLFSSGTNFISNITNGPSTTISTTTLHNMFVGQEIAIKVPFAWNAVQFNSNRSSGIPGSPRYAVVSSVVDSQNVVVNIDSTSFNTFNSNIPFANYSGLSYSQLITVGDYNMGGSPLSTTSNQLYPSPFVNSISSVQSPNGPGIQGSFENYSRYGFLIGDILTPSIGQFLYWEAALHDVSMGVQLPQL